MQVADLHLRRQVAGFCIVLQVLDIVRTRIQPTAHESERVRRGDVRWEVALRFASGDAVTIGWMTKRGGWALVEGGLEALEQFPSPDQLYAELPRRYRDVDQRRLTLSRLASGPRMTI